MPGFQLGVGNAVDQQVGLAAGRAGVFLGEAPPGQAPGILLARLEGGGAAREGAFHHRLAGVVENLHVDPRAVAEVLQVALGVIRALVLVTLHHALGQPLEGWVVAEDPGVLVEGAAQQDGQAGHQGQGQPERCQDSPEE
ncbi:hypothetical protein D3C84_676780 [compost metagenome]